MINFKKYNNVTDIIIGNEITLSTNDFSNMFGGMPNLTRLELPHSGIVNIDAMCAECTNLTTAVCGDNVTNMYRTYRNCKNLKTAVCGPNVTDFS